MIPRGTPDLSWSDLLAALVATAWPNNALQARTTVEACAPGDQSLACLSVRSGFDLVLQALALPPGSEILVSGVTIPGMLHIIDHHGLVAVPLDLDPKTLAVDPLAVEQAIGPRTRAILIAHLFGSVMPLDEIARVAERHDLLLIEDCAQAYDGWNYSGHPASDVCMWSFGPIKTATALGGALLCFKDANLLATARLIQRTYPRQRRRAFGQRIVLFAALKRLSSPALFHIFVGACQLRGIDYDQAITSAVRGFSSGDLIQRIRRQPSTPLLDLLARRIAHPLSEQIKQRRARALRIIHAVPDACWPGAASAHHSFWVLPIATREPDSLVRLLRAHGFDATRRASSLVAVPPAPAAEQMLDQLVYLPLHPRITRRDEAQLCQLLNLHCRSHSS